MSSVHPGAGMNLSIEVPLPICGVFILAKVFTIPVLPDPARRKGKMRNADPRYIEGQRLLVDAMRYLVQQDQEGNRDAVLLLSEHFRTRFRMSDRPPKPSL
jgi:hypothetical protein